MAKVHKATALSFLWAHVHKFEARFRESDQIDFYEQDRNLEGERSSQFIKDEDSNLLRDVEFIRE